MNMKVLVLAAVALVCGVGFVACDNDGGSGADPQPAESSSGVSAGSSSATKAVSSSGVSAGGSSSSAVCEDGTVMYLTLSYYVCKDNAWVAVSVSSSSSVAVSSSSSSRYNMDSLFNSKLSYGEFTDPRDGQKYRTIVMNPGNLFEYEIFAENLNYGKQVPMNGGQADSTKYCYNDDPWYCEHHFGGLYRWSTAMGFPRACDSVKTGSSSACPDSIVPPTGFAAPYSHVLHQGICPEGWHVMNQSEWGNILGGGVGDILSAVGWGYYFINSKGFSALPGGGAYGTYTGLGTDAMFWLPQETFASGARGVNLRAQSYDFVSYWGVKSTAFSIRCVKDYK